MTRAGQCAGLDQCRSGYVAAVVLMLAMPALALAQPPAGLADREDGTSTVASPADLSGGRYLVVPFESADGDPQAYWLTEASAVILTDDLAALGVAAIVRDDRVRAFDRLRVPAVAALSHATSIRVGQLLRASEVIVGAFDVDGTQLAVTARAIRLDTGRIGPEIVESGPLQDIFDIYARVARRLVPGSPVTAEEMEQGHPPIAALEQYIKGLLADAPEARISFLNQAIRTYPEFHRARLALWSIHTDLGEHNEALAAALGIPADHRLSRRGRFLSAVSLMHLGQYQKAFETFSALQRERSDAALLNNLGIVQLRRPAGTAEVSATAYFSDAATVDPQDSNLFFNLGYAHWSEGDALAAIYWLREAVRRNPADDAAHYVLGVALEATGRTEEAEREKELARQLSSEYGEWERRQPGVNAAPPGLERVKTDLDVPAALRVDSVIVAAGQRDQREAAAFHVAAGRRAYEAERDAEAIAELRRAVFLAPYDSEAHLLLGRAYLRGGRLNEAIDALKISIWSTDTIAARLALVEAYIQALDADAARAGIESILKMDPGNAEALELLRQIPDA